MKHEFYFKLQLLLSCFPFICADDSPSLCSVAFPPSEQVREDTAEIPVCLSALCRENSSQRAALCATDCHD